MWTVPGKSKRFLSQSLLQYPPRVILDQKFKFKSKPSNLKNSEQISCTKVLHHQKHNPQNFAKKGGPRLLPHPHDAEAKGSSWTTSDGTWRIHAPGAKDRTPARSSHLAAGGPSSRCRPPESRLGFQWCGFAGWWLTVLWACWYRWPTVLIGSPGGIKNLVLLLVLLTESEHWILFPISSDQALFPHDFFLSQWREKNKAGWYSAA